MKSANVVAVEEKKQISTTGKTRLTYNCAHLRSMLISDNFLGENLLGEIFLGKNCFWVKIF